MSDIPEYDPTKDDMGATGGARGGGDDDAQDLNLPGEPTETPEIGLWEFGLCCSKGIFSK